MNLLEKRFPEYIKEILFLFAFPFQLFFFFFNVK